MIGAVMELQRRFKIHDFDDFKKNALANPDIIYIYDGDWLIYAFSNNIDHVTRLKYYRTANNQGVNGGWRIMTSEASFHNKKDFTNWFAERNRSMDTSTWSEEDLIEFKLTWY